ncbi:uncharacterized protein BJX67DRAFT_387104 [Aspergillus lucknowensis]|uniref:chitinase n=1 Tax=Aspergillus lucknowensis TaxID=176173 RepID=A0ABR4LWT4_9EURO
MVSLSMFRPAIAAFVSLLLLPPDGVVATPGFRKSASPGYRSADVCPERCSVSGPNPANWSVYPNFDQIKKCKQTMFYDFSLYDPVDDKGVHHKIHACSSYGPDFSQLPAAAKKAVAVETNEVEFEMGWWQEGFGLAASGLRSLVKQLRVYAKSGHGDTDRPFTLYGRSGQATIGLYVGQGLLSQGLGDSALKTFQDNLGTLNVSTPTLAMQLCDDSYDSTHIFGIIATSRGTFAPVQDAIQSWANASCLSFEGSAKFPGQAMLTTPLIRANHTGMGNLTSLATRRLHRRAECSTVQVEAGNGCEELAAACGITPAEFTEYNPGDDFCSTLKPKQHVCCSEGDLPDFSPKPNEDGSCFTYTIQANDNCDSLGAEYSLTEDNLEEYNTNTWGWNGCGLVFKDSVICLSEGTPPFPAPIANAVCGPQKPGSEPPTDGSDISEMNPCPLNACCNIWGQCGITRDFCIDTNTGAPGTAEEGTYGCISNCGLDVIKGSGSGGIKIGYYQGYCLSRQCLYQDASQIDTSKYTHLHFGFGTLTPEFDVLTGDALSTYQFGEFKRISDAKRILSFGGWDFSNGPDTYKIFRNGVTPENRVTMATKIADFIKEHELDGVDIDWEYPGAPDLPEDDPGTEEEGPNYLEFLVVLKNLLPGKSVSIAAPSSYWYLKQFPIDEISKVVDYIVYMTYDLHGQWDAGNSNAQEGCENGNCLRSQVNLTETEQSLAMITKAGVPGEKVVVGVTSYGRSFKMADAGCYGPDCFFTGDRYNSNAKKGKCTGTAGYIADAEIAEILNDQSRVVTHFRDDSSNSDILVYDDDEWVGYMGAELKESRTALYSSWGLGGTTDWATDLQEYHDVPEPAENWDLFISKANAGEDPKSDTSRNGNWTDFTCEHPYIVSPFDHTASENWRELNAPAAWEDVVRIWEDTDSDRGLKFIESVTNTLQVGRGANCGQLTADSCVTKDCPDGANGDTSGPAAELIWNSLVQIHLMHKDYHDTLFDVAAVVSTQLDDMENKFAPVPPEEDNMWLNLLIDLIGLGTLGTAGPFFNSFLKKLPYFVNKQETAQNIQDTTMVVVAQGTNIAKDVLPKDDSPWTPEKQDAFSAYMGQTIDGWANISSLALEELFSGTPEAIKILEETMADGKLSEGSYGGTRPDDDEVETTLENDLRANIQKCFFGYSIPALWRVSKAYSFIIDAGHGCGEKQLSDYLEDKTMDATGACVDDKQYYLVYPDGDASVCECEHITDAGPCQNVCRDNKFSVPPGLDSLKDGSFGGITKEDLIKGSVRTWIQNGRENGAEAADPTNEGTMSNLMDVDVTTPGFMRIPVCSPERAFQSWDTAKAGSSENYPCDIPPGKDECGDSTFDNETSDASPNVDDCMQIIKNIRGDASTDWTTQVVGKNQREIASHGGCAFGVEATKVDGNVNFVVGGQDVIDIIEEAVRRFGGDGKVGAKGDMSCNGNIKKQPVKWGIY